MRWLWGNIAHIKSLVASEELYKPTRSLISASIMAKKKKKKALNGRSVDAETLKNIHVNTQGQIAPMCPIKSAQVAQKPELRFIIHRAVNSLWH